MATSTEDSPFFQSRKAIGGLVVKDPPKFDLEAYIANYEGITRIQRLEHIGSHSPYLAVEAYRMAISELRRGKNSSMYRSLVRDFSKIASKEPMAMLDTEWAEKQERENKAEEDKLEHELRSYKNNLIQESIRMGNEDLGHFYYAVGDYPAAFRAYGRMREHCTSAKHLLDMSLQIIRVGVAQEQWTTVQSHLARVDSSTAVVEKEKLAPLVSALLGLANMRTGSFRDAANAFLRTSPLYLTLEPAAGITWQKEILSGNDIAVYGALCALATMDRSELQTRVLLNANFRNFLELEPHLRRAITLFCNSKYSACLDILESYRNDYLLDFYLSKFVSEIYRKIRVKSIVQYFIPFSCVTLDEMTARFQVTGEYTSIEEELQSMIEADLLDARIDLVDRLLISPPTDARHDVHAEALAMAEKYEHTLQLRLTRINMLNAGLVVRPDKAAEREEDTPTEGMLRNESLMGKLGSKLGLS